MVSVVDKGGDGLRFFITGAFRGVGVNLRVWIAVKIAPYDEGVQVFDFFKVSGDIGFTIAIDKVGGDGV